MIGIIVILSWLGIPCLKRILLGHICGLCSALSEQYCSLNCEFSTFLPMSIASRHRSSTLLTGGAGNFAPACFFADRKIVYVTHAILWQGKVHYSHFPPFHHSCTSQSLASYKLLVPRRSHCFGSCCQLLRIHVSFSLKPSF